MKNRLSGRYFEPTNQSVRWNIQKMKDTFFNLLPEKQNRIISAGFEEFSLHGYERTSLDIIIRRAGISKGGLYEYIESKEDLFVYLVEYAYNELYRSIYTAISAKEQQLSSDPLERTKQVSAVAVEFYMTNPELISFIVKAAVTMQNDIRTCVLEILDRHFLGLYAGCDFSTVQYPEEQILSLLKWLLLKTRNDFMESVRSLSRPGLCREAYLDEWAFFLDVLKKGIYTGQPAGQP